LWSPWLFHLDPARRGCGIDHACSVLFLAQRRRQRIGHAALEVRAESQDGVNLRCPAIAIDA
jgi:hypothetical protein